MNYCLVSLDENSRIGQALVMEGNILESFSASEIFEFLNNAWKLGYSVIRVSLSEYEVTIGEELKLLNKDIN